MNITKQKTDSRGKTLIKIKKNENKSKNDFLSVNYTPNGKNTISTTFYISVNNKKYQPIY